MNACIKLASRLVTGAPAAEFCPRDDSWRYTARPEWSSSGESMWMRLSKFSYCNRLSAVELVDLFGADPADLRQADRWNLQALATILDISACDVQSGFCTGSLQPILGQSATELRYCPACLEIGFHAPWFQWLHIERCPLHDLPLRTGCAHCMASIPYALGHHLAVKPLACSCCAIALIPSLCRPAGRCTPLSPRDVRVFRRWSVYVTHVVHGKYQRCRDQQTGRFTTTAPCTQSATARTPHLTLVNRLFDVPPSLPLQLLARCSIQWRRRLADQMRDSMPTVHRGLDYERKLWPHFAEEFVSYEHQVLRARRLLFADSNEECERGGWQHLLGASLVVPTDAMRCETVAALGWAIRWLGRMRALAPADETSTPALGLTAWLACLAPRPDGMVRDRWHSQVLEWLKEDLRLSAWMWLRVAQFMRSKGCYLLHGPMVNPQDFAIARRADGNESCMFTSISG